MPAWKAGGCYKGNGKVASGCDFIIGAEKRSAIFRYVQDADARG
jgi:hypothetical protein